MAKKKGVFGKLVAFTTAVAAIGGVCYIFRDKIKESSAFKAASDKAADLYDNVKDKMNSDDDFLFDEDDDIFDDFDVPFDDSQSNNSPDSEREYTTISPKASDDTVSSDDNDLSEAIPTIDFGNKISSSESPSAYENEGLSDTSEDPDVLEDTDKLDF